MQSINAVEHESLSGRFQFSNRMLESFAYKSVKIVVFSNKLNFLMPFGPLAILVDKLAGHNVS